MEKFLTPTEKAAKDYGIDLDLLFDNLHSTLEERIDRLQSALDILNELKLNFQHRNGISQKSFKNSD